MPRRHLSVAALESVLDDLQAIHTVFDPVPNIAGAAYGARFCDTAVAVQRRLFDIAVDVSDLLFAETFELHAPTPQPWCCPDARVARALLRVPGAPQVPAKPVRRTPPLTLAEHRALGRRLRESTCRLARVSAVILHLGVPCKRTVTAAGRADRQLRNLCRMLEAKALQENPGGSVIYHGAPDWQLRDATGWARIREDLQRWRDRGTGWATTSDK